MSTLDPAKINTEPTVLRCKDMDGNPVEVTISDEAYRFMKEFKGGTTSIDLEEVIKQSKSFLGDNFDQYLSCCYNSKISRLWQDKFQGTNGLETMLVSDLAKGLLEAYTTVYNEVVEGYEDNTTEMWVKDGEDYRKFTREEDIAALNDAFDTVSSLLARTVFEKNHPPVMIGSKPCHLPIPPRNERDIEEVAKKMSAARDSYVAQSEQLGGKDDIRSFINKTFSNDCDLGRFIESHFTYVKF